MKNFTMFNNLATRDAGRGLTNATRHTASFTPDIDSETDRKRLDNGSMKSHIWKYVAMLLLLLTLGVGQMWGDTYTVAGSNTTILTSSWSPNAASNHMTQVGSNWYLYKSQKTPGTSGCSWKVVKNDSWDNGSTSSNQSLSTKTGTHDYIFAMNGTNMNSVNAKEITKWTVVGNNTAIFGTAWSPTTTANDMSYSSGTYTKTYSGVSLSCGDEIQWKFACNGQWDCSFPGDNQSFTIRTAGTYNITFTFNTSALTATATVTPNSSTHYVFGESPLSWDACSGTAMTAGTDYNGTTIYYLQTNGSRTFKVMDTYNDWSTSANERNFSHVDNHIMRTDIDLTGSGTGNITLPSAGYIIYYPSSNKVCAATSLTNLGKPYTITYKDQGGGTFSGSQTSAPTTHSYGTATPLKIPTKSYYDFGGWFTSEDCSTGAVGNTSSATLGATAYEDDITLYAKWTPKTYTITYKDGGNTAYSGSNSASLPGSYTYGTGIASLTDGVKSGYRFDGWFTTSACTGDPVTSISSSATGAKTFYAKWTENPGGTITLTAGTGGQVSKDGSSWGASKSYSGIKTTDALSIYAQANSGYTFSSWSKTSGSGTITSTSTANTTFTPVANADAELTANFTETKYTVNVALADASQSDGTTAPNGNVSVGAVTPVAITAPMPKTGYRSTGRWTTTGGVTVENATANPTTITATSAGTVRWTFDEDLTSNCVLHGGFDSWGDGLSMSKKTGESTGTVVWCERDFTASNSPTQIKVTEGSTWYGANNSTNSLVKVTGSSYSMIWNLTNQGEGQGAGGGGYNINFYPSITGTYRFKYDYSNHKLQVYYPVVYQLQVFSASPADATNTNNFDWDSHVGNVYSKTLSLNANTTYEFKCVVYSDFYGNTGEMTAADHSNWDMSIDVANCRITTQVAGDYTFDFTYTGSGGGDTKRLSVTYPTAYTVTYGLGAGGSTISASATSAGGTFSSGAYVRSGDNITFTQTPATGYTLKGWYTTAAGSTAVGTMGVSDNVLNNLSGNATVYAQYSPQSYTVTLDVDEEHKGTIAGATTNHTVYYNTVATSIPNLPTGEGTYGLGGYYTDHNGAGTKLINGDGTWIASVAGYTDANKKWIHDGDVTLYAYYTTSRITGYTYSTGSSIIAPSTSITVTAVVEPTPAVTTHIDWKLRYNNDNIYSPQPSLGTGSTTSSFETPASSATYRLEAVLRTGSTANAGTTIDSVVNTFQVAGEHTVTVQYKYGSTTIKASAEVTATPLAWSDDIAAPSITGYTFSDWTAGDGVTIKTGETSTATTHIKATYDGTLTANYTKKRVIYFYNTLGWSNVYVYFYKTNDSYWNNSNGTGTDPSYFNGCYSGKHGQMQPIATGSKIYYFDAEAAEVDASYVTVAFTEKAQDNCWYFYDNNKVIRRSDYHSTTMPMFVPLGDQTAVNMNGNTAKYYSNGYWMNYPENTGYTLKIYNWYGDAEPARTYMFPYSEDLKMPLTLDVDFTNGEDIWFSVYRNDNVKLGKNYEIKQDYNDPQTIIENDDNKLKVITSVPGTYKFTLGYTATNYYIDVDYPAAVGDYRILYKDNATWAMGAHNSSWELSSDVINKNSGSSAKQDTVSFFISKGDGISVSMKFQEITGINGTTGVVTWSDVASGSITIPSSEVTKAGVYNFIVSQPAGGASISLEKVEPYTGNYYIRTDCAGNTKWNNYKTLDHQMTYSDYAAENSGYTHYFAHWVTNGINVKFCIANDYSMCLTEHLAQDYGTVVANINSDGDLLSGNANVRFMYNEATNKISRAYISGSGTITDRFLVLEGDAKMYDEAGHALTGDYQDHDNYGTKLGTDNQVILHDDQNFVYERSIQVNTGARAKLTAKYNNNVQYFKGSAGDFADGTTVQLLGGSATGKHSMRIVYDFKTNRLVTAYIPSSEVTEAMAINADLMLVREHQEAGQQLTFSGTGALSEVHTVYGVMRFNRWTLNNKEKTYPHSPLGDPKSLYERALYWISFPFDVNLSDVFGFGTYGVDWLIEYYDGEGRAEKGYWADSPTFWRYVMDRNNFTLEAGKGYVLALDLDRMKDNNLDFWANNIEQIELFFPSASNVNNIEATNTTTSVHEHACTIDRTGNNGSDINKNRTKADSHWNLIGVPSYANYGSTLTTNGSSTISWLPSPYSATLPYLYEWNAVDNTYTVQSGTTYPFKSMHAYFVQYHGDIYWSLASATPAGVARRAYAEAPETIELKLQIQRDEKMVDQTFVKLSSDEQVRAEFVFDEDLCKEFNSGKTNIYTYVDYLPVAGNTLPMSEQTTIVPVGLQVASEGEYTLVIPEGTSGVGVTLIDKETGIRTNLSGLPYTVTLSKGNYDNRFVLEISPISYVATEIENSEIRDQKSDVRKVLIDGLLYIIHDNKMFDARGARVQ